VSLIEVEFSEGLQYIGDRSFEGCESSVSIPVPSTVRKMGTGVFSGCFALTPQEFRPMSQELKTARLATRD
jgi:hypothetical protein